MPKTKVQPKKTDAAEEEKIIEPDLVAPVVLDEDALEADEEDEDDGNTFDKDTLNPYDDRYEE